MRDFFYLLYEVGKEQNAKITLNTSNFSDISFMRRRKGILKSKMYWILGQVSIAILNQHNFFYQFCGQGDLQGRKQGLPTLWEES